MNYQLLLHKSAKTYASYVYQRAYKECTIHKEVKIYHTGLQEIRYSVMAEDIVESFDTEAAAIAAIECKGTSASELKECSCCLNDTMVNDIGICKRCENEATHCEDCGDLFIDDCINKKCFDCRYK